MQKETMAFGWLIGKDTLKNIGRQFWEDKGVFGGRESCSHKNKIKTTNKIKSNSVSCISENFQKYSFWGNQYWQTDIFLFLKEKRVWGLISQQIPTGHSTIGLLTGLVWVYWPFHQRSHTLEDTTYVDMSTFSLNQSPIKLSTSTDVNLKFRKIIKVINLTIDIYIYIYMLAIKYKIFIQMERSH